MPQVISLDHLVLTVDDLDQTIAFYPEVLGMVPQQFQVSDGTLRWSLVFGAQKINLHPADGPFYPKARTPQPGSADLCFLSDVSLVDWHDHFDAIGVVVEAGPVRRSGAIGPIMSLYIRDPDGNLIEVSHSARSLHAIHP